MEILRDEKVGEPKPNVFDYTQESCLKLLFFGSVSEKGKGENALGSRSPRKDR